MAAEHSQEMDYMHTTHPMDPRECFHYAMMVRTARYDYHLFELLVVLQQSPTTVSQELIGISVAIIAVSRNANAKMDNLARNIAIIISSKRVVTQWQDKTSTGYHYSYHYLSQKCCHDVLVVTTTRTSLLIIICWSSIVNGGIIIAICICSKYVARHWWPKLTGILLSAVVLKVLKKPYNRVS